MDLLFSHSLGLMARRSLLLLLTVLALLAVGGRLAHAEANAPQVTTRYVTPTGSDAANSCDNSATPCQTIQHAIDQAIAGDQVKVAAGTYREELTLIKSIIVSGGFDPASVDGWNRSTYTTTASILDGENKHRLVLITSSGATGGVLENFTIRNGNASTNPPNNPGYNPLEANNGGGVVIKSSNGITLRNLTLTNNLASETTLGSMGGAVAVIDAQNFLLEQVRATNNQANRVEQVNANSTGGAIVIQDSVGVLRRSYLANNRTGTPTHGGGLGGGIAILNKSNVTIEQSIILSNTSQGDGGGIGIFSNTDEARVTINSTLIARNAAAQGGAIYLFGGSRAIIDVTNVTIADNNQGSAPQAIYLGGQVLNPLSTVHVLTVNYLLLSGNQVALDSQTTPTPQLNINGIMLGADVTTYATGNLPSLFPPVVAAVKYANPAAGDYQHAPDSPAVDRLTYTGKVDINGYMLNPVIVSCTPRTLCPVGRLEDYGAFEYVQATPNVRYVSPNGADADNNCLSASHPCASPQHAAALSLAGDEVRVAHGLYTSTQANCTVAVLCIHDAITVTGGYTDSNWLVPSSDILTVIDGEQQYRGVSVEYTATVPVSGLFQNFTVSNGYANNGNGGGIAVNQGASGQAPNFTIRNVWLANNRAANDGGGLFALKPVNLTVSDALIFSNSTVDGRGGGVAIDTTDPSHYTLTRLQVFSNAAHRPDDQSANGGRGGGLFLEGKGLLTQSEIYSNTADFTGGGVSTGSNNADPTVDRCIISDNKAGVGGGFSIFLTGGATLQNSLLIRNVATSTVGLLSGQTNIPVLGGNAIHTPYIGVSNEPFHAINVTVADNTGAVPEAIKVEGNTIANPRPNQFVNILISGSPVGIKSDGDGIASLANVLIANDVATPTSGFNSGKLTGAPLTGAANFVGGGDYHLKSGSAAIDAGQNAGLTVDLDGSPRPLGAAVEIGAYEFVPAKQNQTITFPAIGNRLLSQSPVALTASASSGLPVTFTSQTPTVCTVNNGTAILLQTGLCTIVAAQAGSIAFNPAPAVSQSFQVSTTPIILSARLFLPLVRR